MKYIWGRTIITLLIIVVFLMPITAMENDKRGLTTKDAFHEDISDIYRNGTTWYVDDDAIPPYLGTQEQPFRSIQDGVDNASDGDTIFVYNGTYYENVIVEKSIDLIGENMNDTIIQGGSREDVILVLSDRIRISRFTIDYNATGGGNGRPAGIAIVGNSSHNTISNNNFKTWYTGIILSSSDESNITRFNIVADNVFNSNLYSVRLVNSNNNSIYNNLFNNSNLEIIYSSCNNIYGNSFINGGLHIWSLWVPREKDIRNNVFDNLVNGKPLVYLENKSDVIIDSAGQIIAVNCEDIVIKNKVLSKTCTGIYLLSSKNITISNCCFLNISEDAIDIYSSLNIFIINCEFNDTGVYSDNSSSVNILQCLFEDGYNAAIYFEDTSNSIINNCTIHSNFQHGIYYNFVQGHAKEVNIISNNTIINNGGDGIYGEYCDHILVINNTIDHNDEDGIEFNYCNNVSYINNTVTNNQFDGLCFDYNCSGNKIINNTVSFNREGGIELVFNCSNNEVRGNIIQDNAWDGLYIGRSSNYNIVANNTITSNLNGIALRIANNNKIYGNNIKRNIWGINLIWGENFDNYFYHNNLAWNCIQAFDRSLNHWDAGYFLGGNYWSNYLVLDLNRDGIGDRPKLIYPILNGNIDHFPLKNPYLS